MEKITDELMSLCVEADKVNRDNLMTILSDSRDTEFGQKYGFGGIKSVEEYKSRVPIMEYADLKDYIDRMMKGEQNVLTTYHVDKYCSTSGTTGVSKYLPKSDLELEKEGTLTEDPKKLFLSEYNGKRLMLSSYRTYPAVPGSRVFLISEMFYKYLLDSGNMEIDKYIGGKDLFFVPCECSDMIYAKAYAALASEELQVLESTFLYEMLNFFGYIKENWRKIVDDIRAHRLPENLSVPQGTKDFLLSVNVPEERLKKVEVECSKGFANIAKRLWPHLELLNGIGNKYYLTEDAALSEYVGDIPRQYYCYCSSESLIGIPPRLNEYNYVMVLRTGFFEFLPYMAEDSVTYQPHELKIGGLYEPVITNFSGLYRYRLGDIIKVNGFIGKSPVIEFMFRKGQVLNIAGEKIDTRQLEQAVYGLREHGLEVEKYCVGAVLEHIPGRYFSVMAVGSETDITDEAAAALLDESLKLNSPDYKELREMGQIGAPAVMLCGTEEYERFNKLTTSENKRTHGKAKHIYPMEVPEEKWVQIIQEIRQGK